MSKKSARRRQKPNRWWNYPRPNLGPIHRWIPSWRIVLAGILGLVLAGVVAFVTLYLTISIPKPAAFATAERTTVYYADKSEMGTFSEYNRTSVSLDTLPDHVAKALVASEDATFYTNNGIDLRGIARALVNNVKGGSTQGGSTLTQQYVENYYLGSTHSYSGKIKEAILALKIDQSQSKDQILENYLNTIYFGRGAYGIESAAQSYFGVHASELSTEQAALLVGIIPAPSAWDPAVNPDRAQARFNRVISRMVKQGYLSQSDADGMSMPSTITSGSTGNNQMSGTKGYLLAYVRQELVDTGQFTEAELDRGGLKIYTSFDPKLQQYAQETVDNLPSSRPDNNYVGMMSVDPRNGEILMMYGGADYMTRQRNTMTQDRAQAGSTFKAFALLAAMKQDISLYSRWDGNTPLTIGGIKVQNYDGVSRGSVNLLTATQHSINTAFVSLNEAVGPANTKAAAIEAGIPADTPGLDESLTNVLGSASPRGIDMAQAYSTFANGGATVPNHAVVKVQNKDGKDIYDASVTAEQKVDKQQALEVNKALEMTNTSGGTGAVVARTLGRPSAGKSGTSSGPWSAWYVGYVPQMLTVVNMFQVGPNGEEQKLTPFGRYPYAIGGNTYPVDMWAEYMVKATAGMEVMDFEEPASTSGSTTPSYGYQAPVQEATQAPVTEAPTAEATEPVVPEPTSEATQPAVPEPTKDVPEQPAPAATENGHGSSTGNGSGSGSGSGSGNGSGNGSGAGSNSGGEAGAAAGTRYGNNGSGTNSGVN